ncbi:MAG: class I SAM-dependent methyltransferase [Solirubrobacterales bacterium]|nr:class I SAM-dependent methyltransferase [Solirubrobacterales bacterium]
MGTADQRAAMRRMMFHSQDGVVLCLTLRGLEELGILERSLTEEVPLSELCPELTEQGFAAIRAGIRTLAGQGWLEAPPSLDPATTVLGWTGDGRTALAHRHRYAELGEFLSGFTDLGHDAWSRPWDTGRSEGFLALIEPAAARWRLPAGIREPLRERIVTHLNGGLVVPMMVWLRGAKLISEHGPTPPHDPTGEGMRLLLEALGWIGPNGDWTDRGRWAAEFARLFGMVASYLPLLARLPQLYRGELTLRAEPPVDGPEWHVHRELNLSVSSIAHRRYFEEADSIFGEVFDREPVREQPRFIADMGCGDGSWLARLYELIRARTLRGRRLDTDPLSLVGIDTSPAALDRAGKRLEGVDAPALLIAGDVTDPDRLKADLAGHGLAIEDGLHVRAFLDHNRRYHGTEDDPSFPVPGWSSGAYIGDPGRALSPVEVERDLVAHLRRWAPHVRRHGLVVLEAHSVTPWVAARHLGALHAGAFDAYHAYSNQYPLEHQAFLQCCREAGLESAGYCERQYPSRLPFVSVSLNRLIAHAGERPLPGLGARGARADSWEPEPGSDLADGKALHRLMFADGDIRAPRAWCAAPTGFVVRETLRKIESRIEEIQSGEAIRVMDYGAGTGTATIELLKACRERGIERRLERLGAGLEIHLVDLPSSWFAQGFELLRDCAWTSFHSLRAADGGFRRLNDVVAGAPMDAVMASMVFHLIPPRGLERAANEIASVLAEAGRLSWSAPDLGPPGPGSALLHDPNRALRARWLELLRSPAPPGRSESDPGGEEALGPELRKAVLTARASLDEGAMRAAQRRADRRVLPHPLAADVDAALSRRFRGEIHHSAFEMLTGEILDALLVPSNQAEFLPEIEDGRLRERVIRELMLEQVLPAMRREEAGTALGLNLHWTLGSHNKRG